MLTDRFLKNRRGVELTRTERMRLEDAITDVVDVPARTTIVRAGEPIHVSNLLIEGYMSRYIDDRKGLRQLVGMHVPGDFVDLHSFPMMTLDHNMATLTAAKVAIVPHTRLRQLIADDRDLALKLWFSTLVDASLHRAWLFRVGRLDAVGRVAHFLSEVNARLEAVDLSDGHRFALGITQADLAEACGLTSVHTNRVMRQLREMKLCAVRAPMVDILDRAALERRGNFDPYYLYLEAQQDADVQVAETVHESR
ncbi:MAG: Crp/Fnr family transcriptional regulator [Sphingobium sp.]|nr:Crp/Fnr family transcriptional regulator [Sphingobium sp.]